MNWNGCWDYKLIFVAEIKIYILRSKAFGIGGFMTHSKEETAIMAKYENSIDPEVLEFVKGVLNGEDRLNYITVAFMPDSAAAQIEKLTGKKVEGSRIVLDINAIKHIENRHGENGKQDHSMRNVEDIARMGYVIMNYDDISYDGITTTGFLDEEGKASPMVRIAKRIDGTYYVIEAVNSSKKKRNYVVTAYIQQNKKEQ